MATRQPSCSGPTRLAAGTRTSSRNSSLNSDEPRTVCSGRTSMPGVSMSRTSQLMPLCFGVGVGAHEQLGPLGDLGERRPDLLPADDVVVAVADRAGAQRRQVGPGRRLAEALAPHLLALEDVRQVARLLLVACPRRSASGPACSRPTKLTPTFGALAAAISSRNTSCSAGVAPRPPYSVGQSMPA